VLSKRTCPFLSTTTLHTSNKNSVQWNLYLLFPDNSFSQIRRSIPMVHERILFQLWLPHLLFSRIHCFFFRPPMKTKNRGFTAYHILTTTNTVLSISIKVFTAWCCWWCKTWTQLKSFLVSVYMRRFWNPFSEVEATRSGSCYFQWLDNALDMRHMA
jgi:hypothetical protein